MQRTACLALLSAGAFLFPYASSGQAAEQRQPTSQSPVGYFQCDKISSACSLKAARLAMKRPVTFSVQEVWQYHLQEEKWAYLAVPAVDDDVLVTPARLVLGANPDPTVQVITATAGLFWVKWTENGVSFKRVLHSGMLCNDVLIGPKRKGDLIATCVPGKDHATAAYVPDPEIYCVKK